MTLTPSATELVVEVAGRDTVVGYDRYSDQLALELEPKPMVVGDFLSPSFEAIVRLRPQLVVADALQDKVVQGLKAAEIPTLALPMHTVEDVWQGALAVGDATGHRARAAQVVAAGRATISRARQRGQRRSKRARVLVVIDRSPDVLSGMVAAGPGSYVDQLLSIIGADNVLGDSKVRYPRIAAEQIRRSRPDVIVDASADAAKHLGAWKRLADVEAVAKGRVVPTSDRRLTSPSVQAPSMLPEFERMVYGSSSDESATGQGH